MSEQRAEERRQYDLFFEHVQGALDAFEAKEAAAKPLLDAKVWPMQVQAVVSEIRNLLMWEAAHERIASEVQG